MNHSQKFKSEVLYRPSKQTDDGDVLDHHENRKDTAFLYFSSISASIVIGSGAINWAWTSPALLTLTSNNTSINPLGRPITAEEESFFTGIYVVACMLGNITIGKLPDIYGRKKFGIVLSILFIISFCVAAFSTDLYLFCVSRILGGICFGLDYVLLPMYLSEITEDRNRGKFGTLLPLLMTLGTLYVFAIAPFFSFRALTLTCALPLCLNLPCLCFIPESPMYLMLKGDVSGTVTILRKLRGRMNVQSDVEDITKILDNRNKGRTKGIIDVFRTPELRKVIIIATVLLGLRHSMGLCTIIAFVGPIFVTGGITVHIASFMVGLTQVISNLASAMIVDRLNKRKLLLFSCILSGVFLTLIGIYFYLRVLNINNEVASWLAVACVLLLYVSYYLAMGTVPNTLMNEMFPADVKSVSMGIATFASAAMLVTTVFGFPLVSEYLGIFWCFWYCALASFLASLFIYFFIPDTTGKNIMEIQKIFTNYTCFKR